MNREFLDLYNRELILLKEQAAEFAEEYPGVAERLGGLVEERSDPMIVGLLEGAAFLAARVQLKLKHEFPEFTQNLLDQLVPNYLAPIPSVLLARVAPTYGDPALREGQPIAKGSLLDATYRERERQVACRYSLSSDVTLWPFEIAAADYFATPGPLQALGADAGPDVVAGLKLTLVHRTAARPEDEPSDKEVATRPAAWFAGCSTRELPVHLVGPEADAVALYEQLFSDCRQIWFRHLDAFGDPVVRRAPAGCLQPVGFEPDETLLPKDTRVFDGFDLVRDYFLFPRKFLGFRLTGLAGQFDAVKTRTFEVLFAFDEVNPRLSTSVQPSLFALYAAPAVNLFEKAMDRVPIEPVRHEHHVIPDRSRYLDFEPHRVLDVYAHSPGHPDKRRVRPLYSRSSREDASDDLVYTMRRVPRRRSGREKARGVVSDYVGTDMFISLGDLSGIDTEPDVAELSVRALCSNRHLPEQLPVGEGGADFRFTADGTLDVICAISPTVPREPIVGNLRSRTETAFTGVVAWRLINMLSLNHLGLVGRGAGAGGQALREILTLFADLRDSAVERRIRGVRQVDSRPVVRRLRQRTGTGTARGTEITVTFDETAFEGSGVFLLGAVLDRFFADYSGLNHFTQTVVRTVERGVIMRWPPRVGSRRPL